MILIAFFILFVAQIEAAFTEFSPKGNTPIFKIPNESEIQIMEKKLIYMINRVRNEQKLPSLKHWNKLSDCARHHSKNMAVRRVPFGHSGFKKRANEMHSIGKLQAFGENVAYTKYVKEPLEASLAGWLKSPTHKKNILGSYTETGIGISFTKEGRCFLTQLFAKRCVENDGRSLD